MTKQEEIGEGIDRELDAFAQTILLHPFNLLKLRKIAQESMLGFLDSQGVVIKVEGELPSIYLGDENTLDPEDYQFLRGMRFMVNAGYVAVEPLIEEGK